jgi:hypothetical protein
MPKKFWISWSNHGINGPRRTTYDYARQDADNLARQHPGMKFYVLEALDYRLVDLPPVITHKL